MSDYFVKFNAIDNDYICTDKHIHSSWTDGGSTVLEVAKKASERGLKQIAIADHVRSYSSYFTKYAEEINRASRKSGLEILIGFEAKIKNFDGDIDAPASVMKRAQIKVASVHRFPLGRKLYFPKDFNKKICQEIELELSLSALKNGGFNVLGHPGGMSLEAHGEFPNNFFGEIILQCKKNNIAFELNSRYHRRVLKKIIPLLSRHNVLVSLGSDAHTLQEIGNWVGIFSRCKWVK